MRDAFEPWMGQEVVLQLGLGLIRVSLRGVLLQDLRETLLLKPEAGPSLEIAKAKVLAIEETESGPNGLPQYVILPRIHSTKVLGPYRKENSRRQVV